MISRNVGSCLPEPQNSLKKEAKMGIYKYIRENWEKNSKSIKQDMIKWRREPSVIKIKRPTRLDRARSLGYRAKQGILLVRVKLPIVRRMRPLFKGGRRPKHYRRRKVLDKNYQQIAEERAKKKIHNFEVLNSYFLAKDGKHYWFEVILVDPNSPVIKKDKQLAWITEEKGRVYKGKTSSGRKSRGLRNKGKGSEKMRPSKRAHYWRTKSMKRRLRTAKKQGAGATL